MPRPWTLDAAGPFVDRLLNQIVGFRLRIERMEGKWKMSQNHPTERREKVIRALESQGGENAVGRGPTSPGHVDIETNRSVGQATLACSARHEVPVPGPPTA